MCIVLESRPPQLRRSERRLPEARVCALPDVKSVARVRRVSECRSPKSRLLVMSVCTQSDPKLVALRLRALECRLPEYRPSNLYNYAMCIVPYLRTLVLGEPYFEFG